MSRSASAPSQHPGRCLPAENRTNSIGTTGHNHKESIVSSILLQGNLVGEDNEDDAGQSRRGQTLERASQQEDSPRLGSSAQYATEYGEEQSTLQGDVAAKHVGQLAKSGYEGGRSEGVGRDDPIELVEPVYRHG